MNAPPAAETAMVLSGGGAYGAFAVGVMKVLFAGRSPASHCRPLEADIFVGTSVGAFNAAAMAQQGAEDSLEATVHLESVWLNQIAERPGRCGNGIFRIRGSLNELIDVNCLREPVALATRLAGDSLAIGEYFAGRTANFLASSSKLEERLLGLVNFGSFVDSNPYESLLRSVINEDAVRQSPKRLHITATDWTQGTARYFCNPEFQDGNGHKAIMASTAIPGVFPPVRIGKDIYVDGGVVQNTPLNAAIQFGGTNLHVVYLDPNPSVVQVKAEPNTIDTMLRVYYIMLAAKLAEDIETARWINAGLDAVKPRGDSQDVSDVQLRDFVRVAGQLLDKGRNKYRRLTVHRYFPKQALGNDFGMLDFGVDALARMISEGEQVALIHDCTQNGCLV